MDSILGDALSGLWGNDSNNDRKDSSPTPTTNDIDMTPVSDSSSLTPTSNDSMGVTPTSPAAVTERRNYKRRGGTSFKRMKGSNKSKYMYHASVKFVRPKPMLLIQSLLCRQTRPALKMW